VFWFRISGLSERHWTTNIPELAFPFICAPGHLPRGCYSLKNVKEKSRKCAEFCSLNSVTVQPQATMSRVTADASHLGVMRHTSPASSEGMGRMKIVKQRKILKCGYSSRGFLYTQNSGKAGVYQ